MKFIPLNKHVLLKLRKEEEKKQGVLIVPGASKQTVYDVVAVSDQVFVHVKEGDAVIIQPHHGFEVELDGEKYRVVDQSSIAGVIDG